MQRDEWVQDAKEVIIQIIDQERAVTVREIEARAANQAWDATRPRIDPDFLTEARRELQGDGTIRPTTGPTRGGRSIETWSFGGTQTAVERAAARKRLLTARHLSWSHTTKRNPKGLIGQAGETVVKNLLDALDPYSHVRWDTDHVLGTDIPGGSVDASAVLAVETSTGPVALTVLIEIKNQRQWFYPKNRQLHRFLAKAAQLQVENPNALIAPVFVSSWRHNSTLDLAKLLGFYAVAYRVQYVLDRAELDPRLFSEVVAELGYQDLRRGVTPNINLRHALDISLPRDAVAVAQRWNQAAGVVLPRAAAIRDADGDQERQAALDALLAELAQLFPEPAT